MKPLLNHIENPVKSFFAIKLELDRVETEDPIRSEWQRLQLRGGLIPILRGPTGDKTLWDQNYFGSLEVF
jgi:hypothetical protein